MLKAFIVISLVLYIASQSIAFPGEARRYFKDWLVVCQKEDRFSDDVGHCRANTGVRDKELFPYGDGTIFRFTLQRGARSDYHIEFYHTLNGSYPSDRVTFQFDDAPEIALRTKTRGNLAKLSVEQSQPLLAKIKSANALTIRYTSQTGKPVNIKLSLNGATATLLYIKEFYDFRRD